MSEWHNDARRLRADGLTYRAIGAELGLSHNAIWLALKDDPVHRRPTISDIRAREERQRQRVVELYASGVSMRHMAEELGVSISALGEQVRRLQASGRLGRRYAERRVRS